MTVKSDGRDTDHPKRAMRIPKDAPPGIEQDGCGNLIPFDERTEEDREKVEAAIETAVGDTFTPIHGK